MEITSGLLAQALDHKVIQDQFEIVRPDINGLIALAQFGTPVRPYEGSKISWLDMSVAADSTTVTTEAAAAATTLAVVDGSKIRVGMLLLNQATDEYIYVSGVSGNNLTVQRGVGGSTAAIIDADSVLSIESVAREENSTTDTDGIYQPVDVENYFQTMDTAVEMSRRSLATLQFGNTNDLTFQTQERISQLVIQMNKALMRGIKMEIGAGKDKRTFTGGLGYFLSQDGAINVSHGGSALTLDAISELQAQIRSRGGYADTLVLGINDARKLQKLVNAEYKSARLGDFISDQGGLVRLPSDIPQIGGAAQIVIDTHMKDGELYLVNASRLRIVPMAQGNAGESGAWRTMDATQPGQDGQKVRIIGDFAMEIRDSKTHFAKLYNFV